MSDGMFSDVETLIVLVLFKFQILGEYRAPYINIYTQWIFLPYYLEDPFLVSYFCLHFI